MHKERFAGLRKSKRSDILKVIKLLEHWRRLGGADQYILQVENFSGEEFMRILEQDMDNLKDNFVGCSLTNGCENSSDPKSISAEI